MAMSPRSNTIIGMAPMNAPEGNEVAIGLLKRIIPNYPQARVLIYDRACQLKKRVERTPELKQLRHLVVDRFHAYRHSSKCVANPRVHRHLSRAVHKVNTATAEQTFSWLRHYARYLNPMTSKKHEFLLYMFARKHNDLMRSEWGLTFYNQSRGRFRRGRAYGC